MNGKQAGESSAQQWPERVQGMAQTLGAHRKKEIGRARNLQGFRTRLRNSAPNWLETRSDAFPPHLPADPRSPPVPKSLFQLHFDCWTRITLPTNHEVNLLTLFQNYVGKWVMPEARRVMAKGNVFYQGLFLFWKGGSDRCPMLNLNKLPMDFWTESMNFPAVSVNNHLIDQKTTASTTPKSPSLIWAIRTNYKFQSRKII